MIKTILFIMTLLFSVSVSVSVSFSAQAKTVPTKATALTIKQIDNITNTIENHLADSIKKTYYWDEAEEGGSGEGYYYKGKLRLLKLFWKGETGKKDLCYYFDDQGQLIFVYDKDYNYNRPIYYTRQFAKENNDTEAYDAEKTRININRYYLSNNKLIRWIDEHNKIVPEVAFGNTRARLMADLNGTLSDLKISKILEHPSKIPGN